MRLLYPVMVEGKTWLLPISHEREKMRKTRLSPKIGAKMQSH